MSGERVWGAGETVLCHRARDPPGALRVATVLEARDAPGGLQYYVHYVDYDKRLDEWTAAANVRAYDADAAVVRPFPRRDGAHAAAGRSARKKAGREEEAVDDAPIRAKNISEVVINGSVVSAWYYSPYPGVYGLMDRLYICDFCLKYMRNYSTYARHRARCPHRFPPGLLIYNDPLEHLAFFEVDGGEAKLYCQSLCLLSKLFLDHKTLYYDVEPFYFYVLTTVRRNPATGDDEYRLVGYFSKEKASPEGYNLSCLMVLPPYARHGYGKFLISLSYELSKIEGFPGSPEKPLSDLGLVSFTSFWTQVLLREIDAQETVVDVAQLSLRTGFTKEDIISTLRSLNVLREGAPGHDWTINRVKLADLKENLHPILTVKPQLLKWFPHAVAIKNPDILATLPTYV